MVMFTGVAAADTVMLSNLVTVCGVGAVESVTLTVKLEAPAVVGVPAIPPVEAFRVSPGGKAPELIDHEYGAVPPEAVKVSA